jgi:membrane associated rhomboid family serine protease
MGDRDYYSKDYLKQPSIFKPGFDNAIVSLIIFNLIVFTTLFCLHLIYLVIYDTASATEPIYRSQVHGSLNIPADPSDFIYKPWTAISYMFTHFGFWRLFSNMLWLWAFGYIFQTVAGASRVIPAYLYSGFVGAELFVLSYFFFDGNLAPEMSGAAAAIVGLAVAATAMSPNYKIFPMLGNGIPLWILTAVFLILDIGSISSSYNLLVAHLAAGLMGYFFVMMLKQGKDIGVWMHNLANKGLEIFSPEKKYQSNQKQTLYYKARKEPFVKKPNLTQQKLDEILDKINQRGYDSLSEEEKEFLKKASDQL